mmetsp:Transcript_22071/g.47998  ORF Transcript_22071/g.47998 Transcript_22071/m.47998 type:complete len:219 (+) Transcript_22071:366-1022(+)|eukprot:CAMPEP_0172302114 /NCGR_PEP_ID=MMETSP1058-20130122/3868_1 /TAXON_ID=83371 /ORGANISM="Detonula confervacea, Strain CCMP 353" /LENGTH=218 /DNA_ID=CAMNT_0013012473 /DNA_START=350 /DNA_END=1006 /DNA_ORIENTATION=+
MKLSLALSQSLALSSAIIAGLAITSAAQEPARYLGTRGGKNQRASVFEDTSVPMAASAIESPASTEVAAMMKAKANKKAGTFTAPHEVHQFEQVKFLEEPEWECEFDSVADIVGCLKCRNPREIGGEALVVQVKAMYKRVNLNEKNEIANPPREHCIFPGRGYFWTCFNSNLVIEPDSEWLGDDKDKPIYGANQDECLSGAEAAAKGDNGAVYPSDPN